MHRTYSFTGAFHPDSFVAFMAHRARRLTLLTASPLRVRVDARGQPDFLDAVEMACSLRPAGARVRDVIVRSTADG